MVFSRNIIDILNQEEHSRNLSDTIDHSAALAPRAPKMKFMQSQYQSFAHKPPILAKILQNQVKIGAKHAFPPQVSCCNALNFGSEVA